MRYVASTSLAQALGALLASIVLLHASTASAAGCNNDRDCKGERICEAGQCVFPPPPAPPAVVESTITDPPAPAPSATDQAAVVPPPAPSPVAVEAAPPIQAPAPQPAPAQPIVFMLAPNPATTDAHEEPPKRGKALIVWGIVTLSTGYVVAAVSASVGVALAEQQTQEQGATCAKGSGLAYIPLFGPFLTLGQYSSHNVVGYSSSGPTILDCDGARSAVTTLIVVDEILQLGGAGLLTLGIVRKATTPKPEQKRAHLEVLPYAPGADAGLSLRLTTF